MSHSFIIIFECELANKFQYLFPGIKTKKRSKGTEKKNEPSYPEKIKITKK